MSRSIVERIVRMIVQDEERRMYVIRQNHHYLLPYEHSEHPEHENMNRDSLDHFSLVKTEIDSQSYWLL